MSLAQEARQEQARRELERRRCERHPAYLLDKVVMPDERTATEFRFQLLEPCSEPANEQHEGCCWFWQRFLLDEWLGSNRHIALKARQLGVTWLAGGLGLWTALYRPGSRIIIYRQKEADAGEIVERVWDMLQSLPKYLWNRAKVETPKHGARPSTMIELVFPDGKVSTIQGMASTSSAGHGKTVAMALMDEFSRIDSASDLMKAVQPAAGSKGKIIIISTANGVSNLETGEGNYFHFLWKNKDAGFQTKFLGWYCHPDRDQDWYENDPEVRGLRWYERAEQYPADEFEAFTLTNKVFFDRDALAWYAANAVAKPHYRFDFIQTAPDRARIAKSDEGRISVFKEPEREHAYAIGADVATGRGKDFSAAYVIDLTTMELCAEYHGRIAADLFSYQLHFLGRYFNTARIAVEMGGGFGEPVILNLRDGKDGRPAYPNLYRYTERDRPDQPVRKPYGFPMTQKSRPQVISGLERAIREKGLPWVSSSLLHELNTFVTHDTNPSPRAQEGTNDDLVMACAITVDLYRQYGSHPFKRRRRFSRPKPSYPWQGVPA